MTRAAVVILGASGFIGTRLVRQLSAKAGVEVRALDIAPPRERLAGVSYHTADVRQPIPGEYGENAEIIYNLAAVHRTPGHPDHEYFETNVAGALSAAALAHSCAIPTIVFTSSISVYGPSEDLVNEESPTQPATSYGRSKLLAEGVHDQWLQASPGRRLIIVRPGVVFGPGERGNYTHLASALRRGIFVYPGRRDTVKSGGYVDELLRTIDFALARPEPRIRYNFAYPHQSTTQEIVNSFARITGARREPLTVPLPLMIFAARLFEIANALGFHTPIHRDRIMKLVQSTRISSAWLQESGYQFTTTLESALERWHDETGGNFD